MPRASCDGGRAGFLSAFPAPRGFKCCHHRARLALRSGKTRGGLARRGPSGAGNCPFLPNIVLSLSPASNVRSDCSTARVKGRCHLRSADCANPTPKTAFPRCTFCSAVCRNLLVSRLTLCRSGHWVEAENIIAHWDEDVALALPARLIRSSAGRTCGGFDRSYRRCRCGAQLAAVVSTPAGIDRTGHALRALLV